MLKGTSGFTATRSASFRLGRVATWATDERNTRTLGLVPLKRFGTNPCALRLLKNFLQGPCNKLGHCHIGL